MVWVLVRKRRDGFNYGNIGGRFLVLRRSCMKHVRGSKRCEIMLVRFEGSLEHKGFLQHACTCFYKFVFGNELSANILSIFLKDLLSNYLESIFQLFFSFVSETEGFVTASVK